MKYLIWILAAVGGVIAVAFLGLLVKPSQFAEPATPASATPTRLVAIPQGLPAPVDRWYRSAYPDGLPVYDSVAMHGTGVMRMFGVSLPFRHYLELRPERGFYRKMDVTWFNMAFLHGLDTCIDGVGVMNTPVGPASGPKIDQGANVVAWLELLAVPGVLAEDPRIRWEPVDADSARLVVPFADGEDSMAVEFDPATGEPIAAHTARYHGPESTEKVGWTATMTDRRAVPGGMGPIATKVEAQWADADRPWATFYYDAAWPNAAVPGFDAALADGGVKIGDAR